MKKAGKFELLKMPFFETRGELVHIAHVAFSMTFYCETTKVFKIVTVIIDVVFLRVDAH